MLLNPEASQWLPPGKGPEACLLNASAAPWHPLTRLSQLSPDETPWHPTRCFLDPAAAPLEETAPAGADDDVASVTVTVTSVDTATEAVAEAADAEPAGAAARMPPLTTLVETATFGLLRMSRDAIGHIVKMFARRMATRMPETLSAEAPADATPATDRRRAMASKILAKTKRKRKVFDKPQQLLRCLSGRIARTCGLVESTGAPAAPQSCAVRTVADALPQQDLPMNTWRGKDPTMDC